MALNSGGLPENISTALSEFMAQAQRLGIVWSLRLATVTGNADVIQNTSATRVVLDGDTERITANSLIGRLAGTTRVFVLFVPPAGSYIIGRIDFGAGSPPHVFQDVQINGDLDVTGTAEFGNRAHGTVAIDGGGGVIVGQSVTFPTLAGTGTMRCFATANSGSANVKNVSVSAVSNSGFTVNLLRDGGIVGTTCYWLGIRAA